MNKNFETVFAKAVEEREAYELTLGQPEFMFDMDSTNDNDVPRNILIEIKNDDGGVMGRATINADRLLEIAQTMKQKIDEGNYPKWLDERPAHMLSDGTLIRVEEVRFHPEHGMFATVTIFDRNMQPHGQSTVEITGKTDRKALARKIFTDGQNIQEKIGYVIWRLGV